MEALSPPRVRPYRDLCYVQGTSSRILTMILHRWQDMSRKNLEQPCPTELSVMVEICYVHAAQYCSHSLHMHIEYLKCASPGPQLVQLRDWIINLDLIVCIEIAICSWWLPCWTLQTYKHPRPTVHPGYLLGWDYGVSHFPTQSVWKVLYTRMDCFCN